MSEKCLLSQCTVQYSIVYDSVGAQDTRQCTVQYSTVQYSTVQYSTVQYSTVQYSTVQYSIVQYSTVCTVQYSTVQYSTVQYSTDKHNTRKGRPCNQMQEKIRKPKMERCFVAPMLIPNQLLSLRYTYSRRTTRPQTTTWKSRWKNSWSLPDGWMLTRTMKSH